MADFFGHPMAAFVDELRIHLSVAAEQWRVFEKSTTEWSVVDRRRRENPNEEELQDELPLYRQAIHLQRAAFIAADLFLVCTARISCLLFPNKGGDPKRGESLRALFQIPADSPLGDGRARTVRNALAHADEKLDAAVKESGHMINPQAFGKSGPSAIDKKRIMRFFEMDTKVVRLRGEEYELVPLREALQQLERELPRVESAIADEFLRKIW